VTRIGPLARDRTLELRRVGRYRSRHPLYDRFYCCKIPISLIIRTDQCELESSQNMNEIARLRQLSGVTMNVPSMLGGQVVPLAKELRELS